MEAWHYEALSTIVTVAYQDHKKDKRLLSRLSWSLQMAAISTNDPLHRDWIRRQLFEISETDKQTRWHSKKVEGIGSDEIDCGDFYSPMPPF
jgi:hypothetical protein